MLLGKIPTKTRIFLPILLVLGLFGGCSRSNEPTIGVSFDTLQAEFWVESFEILQSALKDDGFNPHTAVADNDENRQLQQIRNFVVRGVDGIIVAPKNDQAIVPAIRLANEENIPIVIYNRPPAQVEGINAITVVADNFQIARDTVSHLVEIARERGGRHKALILVGDLGDQNSIERLRGFDTALEGNEDIIEVVARVPTEWNQEKARSGIINALQINPDISFIFTSSDFLLPSIVAALKSRDKYHPVGHPDHVILGGFDGDPTAYGLLRDGYMDATGVQDLYFEARSAVKAIVDLKAGRDVPSTILDPGFVIHQNNLDEMKSRMWGATVYENAQR